MKFLVFNAVVIAALIFLFNGGNWDNDWSLQGLRDLSFSRAAPPAPVTAKAAAPKPEPKIPAPEVASVKPAAPEPAPPPPDVIKRRAVVLAPQPDEEPAQTRYMSRQKRRQSLLSMAEDMELFSVEATTR